MNLDPRTMEDWQIAETVELGMKPIDRLAAELGLRQEEVLPMGRQFTKVDYAMVAERLKKQDAPRGKYVDVTAITPTPLGEGKTTTTLGLVQGLGKLGKRVSCAIRQPSAGPTFNIKGSAAGGGLSQCIPLAPFSLGLTGDIDRITNAHNLAMVALTARMQHERNYDDEKLAQRNLKRLDIDPDRVQLKWVIDFCAQALRNITIGKGGKMDGYEMESGFQISVSSELMAILALAKDLADLRTRIAKMVVAFDKKGNEITTADLEVDGAMTAWMVDALNPNLLQTLEGQPCFVHAGPFANIAIGQSSIIADLLGTRLSEYHLTESGFAADIGFEKFCNIKCRVSGLVPDAAVIVTTIRALKMHGGGPKVTPGIPLADEYTQENVGLVEAGCENLLAHIEIVKRFGITPVVCINRFVSDSDAEVQVVKKAAEQDGALVASSQHWLRGGEGAIELAEVVIEACRQKHDFRFLYELDAPIRKRIELIAKQIYGANGVDYSPEALRKVEFFEANPQYKGLGICMLKTQFSLSHDPDMKGRPRLWRLPVRDLMVFKGASFIVPIAGEVKLMPGTGSNPAFRRMDVDLKTGKVTGVF